MVLLFVSPRVKEKRHFVLHMDAAKEKMSESITYFFYLPFSSYRYI